MVAQSTQFSPHRVESVFASVVHRLPLNSHCTVLAGHVQKVPLQTLSPMQAGSQVPLSVQTLLTQLFPAPHGLLQLPQCSSLLVVLVAQLPLPSQSAVPCGHVTHGPGTHAFCDAQYEVPVGQGRHFRFFFLQRVAQQSLSFRQRLAPGSTQAAACTSRPCRLRAAARVSGESPGSTLPSNAPSRAPRVVRREGAVVSARDRASKRSASIGSMLTG